MLKCKYRIARNKVNFKIQLGYSLTEQSFFRRGRSRTGKEGTVMENFDRERFSGIGEEGRDVYRTVVEDKNKTRAWSVAALVLGIISIICCCMWYFGLACGILAVIFTVISRKTLGYFDGLAIGGLITAIFGIIFSGLMTYVMLVVMNDPEFLATYEQIMEEYYKELEALEGGANSVFSLVKGLIG